MELIQIAKGKFTMGSDTSVYADERTAHLITIASEFLIGKYEVTQSQWQSVMGTTLPQQCAKSQSQWTIKIVEGGNYPMYCISWLDAKEFINQMNKKDDGFIYSLPSESQWEYAAKAGTTGEYYGLPAEIGWFKDNSAGQPNSVGKKKPNQYGLFDMSGNLYEWCEDIYDFKGYDEPNNRKPESGEKDIVYRIIRGGSWFNLESNMRSSIRLWSRFDDRSDIIGFRVVAIVR